MKTRRPPRQDKQRNQKAERTGKLAELLILSMYLLRGFWPVAWRYRTKFGEIDLIVKKPKHLRFIEVKYRASYQGHDNPISPRQRHRLQNAALYAYHHFAKDSQLTCQFDVVIVTKYGKFHRYENDISLMK